jgi:hypothetical protein
MEVYYKHRIQTSGFIKAGEFLDVHSSDWFSRTLLHGVSGVCEYSGLKH